MLGLPWGRGRTLSNATEHLRSKTIEVQLGSLPNLSRSALQRRLKATSNFRERFGNRSGDLPLRCVEESTSLLALIVVE